MRKFKLTIIPVLAILAGAFFWLGSESKDEQGDGSTLSEQVASTNSAQVGKPGEKLTVTPALAEAAAAALENNETIDNEAVEEEISPEYREFLLNNTSPIKEVLTGLILLANQGDGDALMALIMHAESCRTYDGAVEYCPPGSMLFDYGREPEGFYVLIKDAARKGSLHAMTVFVGLAPAPFDTYKPEQMIENKQLRALVADVVTQHNEDVRGFMDVAAQQLHLPAIREAAYFYAFSPIVDPSRETSALYIMAWSQITGHPIPDDLLVVTDSLDTELYIEIEKRAAVLAERYQEKNSKL